MATTTNYGWTTPDDTALVKDGAAAIRTLGSSIDTTTKALNPETTTGDIAYRSATANTNTRLALGTAGQILTVNSGATAPEWATPAASGGMTSIASGSLSTGTLTLNSISGAYKDLKLVIRDVYPSTAATLNLRLNNDTASNYISTGTQTQTTGGTTSLIGLKDTTIYVSNTSMKNTDNNNVAVIDLIDYASGTSGKIGTSQMSFTSDSLGFLMANLAFGYIPVTAITRIDIFLSAGTFSGGTYVLYGVN